MTNLKVMLFVSLLLCFSNLILSLKIKSRKLGKLDYSIKLFTNSTVVDCSKFKTFDEVKSDFTNIESKYYRQGNTACYCTHCYFLNADCIKNPGLDNTYIGFCIPKDIIDISISETKVFEEKDEITCFEDKKTSGTEKIPNSQNDQNIVNSNNSTSINTIGGNSQINSLELD